MNKEELIAGKRFNSMERYKAKAIEDNEAFFNHCVRVDDNPKYKTCTDFNKGPAGLPVWIGLAIPAFIMFVVMFVAYLIGGW